MSEGLKIIHHNLMVCVLRIWGRKSDTTALVADPLLQETQRTARCGVECTWILCSTVGVLAHL